MGKFVVDFDEDVLDGLEQDDNINVDYGNSDGTMTISSDDLDDDELEDRYGN